LFRACLAIERAAVQITTAAAVDLLQNITNSLGRITWPTPEWQALRDQFEISNNTQGVLDNWISAWIQQVVNRVRIFETFIANCVNQREAALLTAYDALIGYTNGTKTAQQVKDILDDLVLKFLNERRVTLLLAYYAQKWNDDLTRFRQNLDDWINKRASYYRDFVQRWRTDFADGVTTVPQEVKQAILDYLAGYGINPDADVTITVVYVPVNMTLSITVNLNIPDIFSNVTRAQEVGRHIQNQLVRWAVAYYLLDIKNVQYTAYVPPAKRASTDTLSLAWTTQSGSSSVGAALLVFLVAFLFHWTD